MKLTTFMKTQMRGGIRQKEKKKGFNARLKSLQKMTRYFDTAQTITSMHVSN